MCERDPQCKDLLIDNSNCCPKCRDEDGRYFIDCPGIIANNISVNNNVYYLLFYVHDVITCRVLSRGFEG